MTIKNISARLLHFRTRNEKVSILPTETKEVSDSLKKYAELLEKEKSIEIIGAKKEVKETSNYDDFLSLSDEELKEKYTIEQLKDICKELNMRNYSELLEDELIEKIKNKVSK